ncbi:hypothetical protein [Janthinobacterium sp. 17J80-10]|uniref:hypothetical protein n=1 Tax=Janthinobacterium sp. 17J80-10 TaxID=2497863 RepID=UPI0010053448|nr:hypothetical protein [Janthinobacterium sp. 17J80-10]QAU32866.1 hypothetical protein EKL02_01025 [Janthinobacterium sp. 17J80-10]
MSPIFYAAALRTAAIRLPHCITACPFPARSTDRTALAGRRTEAPVCLLAGTKKASETSKHDLLVSDAFAPKMPTALSAYFELMHHRWHNTFFKAKFMPLSGHLNWRFRILSGEFKSWHAPLARMKTTLAHVIKAELHHYDWRPISAALHEPHDTHGLRCLCAAPTADTILVFQMQHFDARVRNADYIESKFCYK